LTIKEKNMSKAVYYLWKIANMLYKAHVPIIPALITVFIRITFAAVIPYSAEIGKNTCIAYGGPGVIIHRRCRIGRNCYIGPGVVLGGSIGKYNVPVIQDNVIIGVGAKVLGDVNVKSNSIIGANAVVTKNVESNCIVGGIPARIIRENINVSEIVNSRDE
jgi:serine O-acetyltransferase